MCLPFNSIALSVVNLIALDLTGNKPLKIIFLVVFVYSIEVMGLTFPDFYLAPKLDGKLNYCGLNLI